MPSLVAAATGTPLCAPTLALCSPWPPRHDSPGSARLPDPPPGLSLTGLSRAGASLPCSPPGTAAGAAPPARVTLPALAGTQARGPPVLLEAQDPDPHRTPRILPCDPHEAASAPEEECGVCHAGDQPPEGVSRSSRGALWKICLREVRAPLALRLKPSPKWRGAVVRVKPGDLKQTAWHLSFQLNPPVSKQVPVRDTVHEPPCRLQKERCPLSKAERASYHFHWIIP